MKHKWVHITIAVLIGGVAGYFIAKNSMPKPAAAAATPPATK